MEALRQADARMTFKRGKDGLLFIEEKSAKEVNISPKLFAFSQRIVDNTNRFILDKALKKNRIPLSKSSSTEGDDGECSTGTDCVAQTISAVLAIFKVNISAAEINKKLEAKYGVGKGVPVSKFTEEVMGYLKGEETTLSSIPSKYRLKGNSSEVYLLGLNVANMGGHAATLISIEGDWLTVKDDQNNRELKIHKEEVLKVYKATGVQ